MTILFIEGFDHYTSTDQLQDKLWNKSSSYVAINSAYKRFDTGNGCSKPTCLGGCNGLLEVDGRDPERYVFHFLAVRP